MRKRNILSLAKAILLSSMFGMSMALPAMPTAEEIAAAEPLVQEVMKAEMTAMRNGKKTREQVGDTAAALAKEARPADKKLQFQVAAYYAVLEYWPQAIASKSLAGLQKVVYEKRIAEA